MARTRNFADVIKKKLADEPELAEAVEAEVFYADIAIVVREARMAAGLSQKKLAELAGTQQSVISRIEDADYEGHSLKLLRRIAKALGKKLRVQFCDGISTLSNVADETFEPAWEEWDAPLPDVPTVFLSAYSGEVTENVGFSLSPPWPQSRGGGEITLVAR